MNTTFFDRLKNRSVFTAFIPKSFVACKDYTRQKFFDDLCAGLNVGCISLPLAMAFAIASGVAPERGLYTAVVAGFLISLFGGSRVQIGGPTGAFVVLVYSTVQKHGYEGLALATFLAGIFLIVAGLLRLGSLIRFIPFPVTTGFTAGIATVIFVSQLKDFAGFEITAPSVHFFEKIAEYIQNFHTVNISNIAIATFTFLLIVCLRSFSKKIPAFILSLLAATILCNFFNLSVKTIENSFGAIPNTLLMPTFPYITMASLQNVLPDAIAIALLGGIESLLSCIVADSMTGLRHKSNCELVGQGIANIASSLCGGIPATGAIARTGANVQSGAKTPVAGMIHACTVFMLMIFFAPYAAKLPLCALSATLMVVAISMSEIGHVKTILKGPVSDKLVLICTYVLTVCIDLTFAVQIGVVLAAFSFLKKMTEKSHVTLEKSEDELAIRLNGPFFFTISEILNDVLAQANPIPKKIVLHLSAVPFIDATALQALKQFQKRCALLNIEFEMTDLQPEVQKNVSILLQNAAWFK